MLTPPGQLRTAVLSGLIHKPAVTRVVGAARRLSAPRAAAFLLLAVAAVIGLVAVTAGALVGLTAAGQPEPNPSAGWAELVALATVTSGLLFGAGLLRLPGMAPSIGVATRLSLDGLIIATALWFVGWVLLAEPTRLLGSAPVVGVPILLATVSAALIVGLATVVVFRVSSPRRRLAALASGSAATTLGGLGIATGLSRAELGLALGGATVAVAGLLTVALVLRGFDRPCESDIDPTRREGEHAVLPILVMAGAATYHFLQDGRFDPSGVAAISVAGFVLVARQSLTLHDVRRYARRLVEREAHFRELAHTDALTGLANRRGLLRALHRCAERGTQCDLLLLDLDGFKNVNDVRGHDAGDAVLAEVGRRLRGPLRPGDLAARLGGDEFAVLLPGPPAATDPIGERLLGALAAAYELPEGPVFLSASIGIAGWARRPDVELLLRHADLALRYAKQRGKNRIERYDVAYDRLLSRRTTLEHELRGAIERDELRLVFQPVASLPSVRPVGAEALLRWRHPELGAVRPDEFIPLAEECGMIAKLGAWVLDQACYQLSRWLADGHDVWVSVNVSPRELHAPAYVGQVAEALRVHRVPPQRLVLEVTEHAVATDLDELIRRLTALRRTGVRIALDDFGAGYSSLGQLRRLPLDILKIDHSLVAGHEPVRPVDADGPAFAPMVDIVMRLGHQLGLGVIAEGVTTPAELAEVVAAGCHFGQGALLGWGVPAEHLEAMLEAATSSHAPPIASSVPPVPASGPPPPRRLPPLPVPGQPVPE
ncbi:putative bifunctional diguanylate cyclase/phosphodiesterase [Salinispora oceanensis]|uniref:putative bifunctional diguanylate cyclase/phosphodiesterase n=1 Tax=Salinispora oceanensis TaxID=1050199 RepID=UPI00036D82BF|nr:bifunctional diguanylate cyclase/phosphodiesterase [Salinispora oceanensis]